jgi:hypothetical protein
MFALTCYFDASYDSPKTTTIVSGWVATTGLWERFDVDWRIMLAKFDVPYFHMREFAHSVRGSPFQRWKDDENKRTNFLRYAVDVIDTYARKGFACVVEHDAFKQVDSAYCLSESVGNPYSLAARDCVAHANVWLNKEQRGLPVEYVFEAGDEGAGLLSAVIERDHHAVPLFAPSRDRLSGQKGLTPLQAADFAAYELLKASRDIGDNAPLWKYRKSLHALAGIPAWWGIYKEPELLDFCKAASIPLRSTSRAA